MTSTATLVDRYFEADSRSDGDAVVDLFTADAVVVDEGRTRRGTTEIRDWRDHAASEYQYTTAVIKRVPDGDNRCTVTVRLEGNFPGGIADLNFDFLLADGLISALTIAPPPDTHTSRSGS
jgi:hypothetical protein